MNNFLITAISGKCGTTFLSKYMNLSKKWTVEHEPNDPVKKDERFSEIPNIQKRFNKNYYGEVNSHLRKRLNLIKVKKYGFIIRNPFKVFITMINRGNTFPVTISSIVNGFTLIPDAADNVKLILFERMISDKEYLQSIFNWFGIIDVVVKDIDLSKKINETARHVHKLEDYQNIPLQNEYNTYIRYKNILMTG